MSPDEFIEEFQARLERAGLCDPDVRVELSPVGPDMSFDYVRVDPGLRGRGLARRVLELLLRLSDETGMPLQVIPTCIGVDGGLSNEQLEVWYLKHGFVPAGTPQTPRLMRRAPRC
jgi:GNAT superfamily N-acetyltransferase